MKKLMIVAVAALLGLSWWTTFSSAVQKPAIGSVLKIKQLQSEKRELLESLEMYYRVFFLGEAPEDEKTEDKSEDSEGKAVDSVENGD